MGVKLHEVNGRGWVNLEDFASPGEYFAVRRENEDIVLTPVEVSRAVAKRTTSTTEDFGQSEG